MNNMNVKEIAKKYNINYSSLLRFIDYCRKSGAYEIPNPEATYGPGYIYTPNNAKKIVDLFKNKKHGEMADYHYKYLWGDKFRKKYPRKNLKK